jgi:hypothetical protein
MTSLTNYISSDRQNASNALRPKETLKAIAVYVEATEDKSFWNYILSPYLKPLDFRAYSNEKLTTGKKGLKDYFDKTGEWLIICLDSDYDYLLQDSEIAENRSVFQTYAYATENLKCYAESLHTICTDVTYNPTEKINFVVFLEEYSKIIHELFIWHLYFYSLKNEAEFTITEFGNIVKILEKFNLNAIDKVIFEPLKSRVNKKINKLKQDFPQEEITVFSNQLKTLGLEDKNTYLFMKGHILYDNVVLNILRVVCDNLKTDSIKEINKSSAEQEHKNKTREHYINSIGNTEDKIKLALTLNKDFKSCFLFEKITHDIRNYLTLFKPPRTLTR